MFCLSGTLFLLNNQEEPSCFYSAHAFSFYESFVLVNLYHMWLSEDPLLDSMVIRLDPLPGSWKMIEVVVS